MRKLLLFISLLIIGLAMPISAFAQSVGIDIHAGTKTITGNSVPYDLYITSTQTVGPIKVQWIIPYGLNLSRGENTTFNANLVQNEIVEDHIVLSYLAPGTYPITANISGVYNGIPFNRSQSLNLIVDNNMNVVNDNSFLFKRIIYLLSLLIALIVIALNIKKPFIYLKTRFLTWLNKEDNMN